MTDIAQAPHAQSASTMTVDALTTPTGLQTTAGSVDFAENGFSREFTPETVSGGGAVATAAQRLPQLNGSGMVRDLREAASIVDTGTGVLDPRGAALASALQNYGTAGTRDTQMAQIDHVLELWAATSDHVLRKCL